MTTNHEEFGAENALAMASTKPKYQRIRDHLHAEIRSGQLAPGQALPSEAMLVKSLGISRHTVRQALAELESDGIVQRVPGSGTFVSTEQQRGARQKLNVFALIAPQLRGDSYPSLINGFEQACTGCLHQTWVGKSGNDLARQADMFMQMIDQQVGGVALVPVTVPPTPAHHVRTLQKNQIPVVFCHRTAEGVKAPSVVFSGREIGLKAGQMLLEHGHRRIALLCAHRYSMVSEREQGLRQAMTDAGVDQAGLSVVEYGSLAPSPVPAGEQPIQKSLTEFLSRPDRPTAIFCGGLPDAEIVYLHADTLGLKIPRDLSLIYFGGTWRERGLARRLSGLGVDEHEVGACAGRLLHEMRAGKRPIDDDEQIVFPVSVLPGETLGPAPDRVT